MKILVNTPNLKFLGGVANHYLGLKPFWTEHVQYNTVGKRNTKTGNGKYWLPWDIVKFVWRLVTFQPDVVLINPSLSKNALKRDFVFLRIACMLRFKVAVFIHGFDWNVAKSINHKWVVTNLNKASLIFILADAFKNELRSWGVNVPIVKATTKVDDRMLEGFDINIRNGENRNLLFCSRVEKAKGIYETIETYRILKERYPDLTLTIVGNGSELNNVKELVAAQQLKGVIIAGGLSGKALIREFHRAALLLLLSSHGEGLPTAVLEGMAFGLPIITRNVGGIPDFFENGKMGFTTDSLSPKVFADAISVYLDNKELTIQTAHYNHEYAKKHFMASKVASSIESNLKTYC